MSKKLYKLLTASALGVAMFAFGASAQAVERLRVAGNHPVEDAVSRSMEVFKKLVEERSNGEIQVDLFPAMQLGGATENVDQVRSGTLFATLISSAYLTRLVPEYEALSLPFLFDNREQAFNVVEGKVGTALHDKMAKQGFEVLSYGEIGFRHVTNSLRPLENTADFQGLRVRLQPNEVHLQTFRALGSNPVSMDVSELYSALQQKVLDAQENPYSTIDSRRFNEVQGHLSDSSHFYDLLVVMANKRRYERLSPEHQEIVKTAMNEAMQWQRDTAEEEDNGYREKLIKAGMTFTSISPETREELRTATAGVVEQVKKRVDPDFVNLVVSEATAQ
ncbi:TRAP transporter substrate-binding protein [Paenalcaligenes niemegkensis]|uniref:TRAP transporter substrate-binding protein n=1 Tax=Paenalcaligenes niemegkensis TaxID=2895469 RepID=UPI001EE97C5F|nr:TRAP transporter substrate-binding protein [Paenalcaligenes niemegkensis]MCQ9617896.1 TRAP transporter substrate-binding protein [Paenalcaligenes niemegkensis]